MGVGAQDDAPEYGDQGSNTLGNLSRAQGGLHLPHLAALGLGNLTDIQGVPPVPAARARGAFGVATPVAAGKDTMAGHWEMMGLIVREPFMTFPDGFPADLIDRFEQAIGREILGNVAASGTEIIEQLGPEQLRTGRPIVYTSADSVFQIAAHEEVIELQELYRICEIARALLTGPYRVGRVIARPFLGQPGSFKRTGNRRDYTVPPDGPTVLDLLAENQVPTRGVGKIGDIFSRQGLSEDHHTGDNSEGIALTIKLCRQHDEGLIFVNLVDFDSKWGHRRDRVGYAQGLATFDEALPQILDALGPEDIFFLTADHGCDPTFPGSDHTREKVPILAYSPSLHGFSLGTLNTLADLGASVAAAYGLHWPGPGQSFMARWEA